MKNDDMERLIDPNEVGQGKKSVFGVVGFIFVLLFLLFVIFEITIGYINLYRINNEKKPYLLVFENIYQDSDKKVITSNFGIYKIIEIEEDKTTKIFLKIWFFDENKLMEE